MPEPAVADEPPSPFAAPAFKLPPAAPVPSFPDPSPVPERVLPDSKVEYAPPHALPASHDKTMPGLAPVSVAPEAPVPASALTTPVAIPSRRPPLGPPPPAVASAFEADLDETRTRDTIPPRSRAQHRRRLGIFVAAGTIVGALVVVALLRAFSGESSDGAVVSRTSAVNVAPATSATPNAAAPPSTGAAADPEPARSTKESARAEAPATAATPKETKTKAALHAPQHPAKAKAVAAKAEAPAAPVTKAAPKPRTDKPRPSARPASPPPQAGGGIVRESPF